jgi:hypothetical protein
LLGEERQEKNYDTFEVALKKRSEVELTEQ